MRRSEGNLPVSWQAQLPLPSPPQSAGYSGSPWSRPLWQMFHQKSRQRFDDKKQWTKAAPAPTSPHTAIHPLPRASKSPWIQTVCCTRPLSDSTTWNTHSKADIQAPALLPISWRSPHLLWALHSVLYEEAERRRES